MITFPEMFIVFIIIPYLFLKPIRRIILNSNESYYKKKASLEEMLLPFCNWIGLIWYSSIFIYGFLFRFLNPFYLPISRQIKPFFLRFKSFAKNYTTLDHYH